MRYVIYAERFGWTPDQVDQLRITDEPWILPIHDAMLAERDRRQQRAIAEAQKQQRGHG